MGTKIRNIYIVHHSHTDVGYTDLQERVIYSQAQNIRTAVGLIKKGRQEGLSRKNLKWNCETAYCVERFWEIASPEEKKAFFDLVKEGAFGISANWLNFNDLVDAGMLEHKTADFVKAFEREGIAVRTAMCADINGISLGARDAMLKNGVEFLYMNIHTHHGMYPLYQNQRPFFWENGEGKRMLVWNGEHYNLGNALGIVFSKNVNFMTENYFGKNGGEKPMERLYRNLAASIREYEESGYPYDFYITSVSGVFSDNAPVNPAIADVAEEFNARYGKEVRMRMVTLQELYGLEYSRESAALVALLHDVCKTGCYKKSFRNVKNDATGQWERVPTYTFSDPLPYGHGEKSVYIVNGFIRLTREEAMAIRWHMGFSGTEDPRTVGQALQKYPLAFALATADMEASYFLEGDQ